MLCVRAAASVDSDLILCCTITSVILQRIVLNAFIVCIKQSLACIQIDACKKGAKSNKSISNDINATSNAEDKFLE